MANNNSTVYVVTSGEYSSYQIDGIFATQQEADGYAAVVDGAEVTPWELNKWTPDHGKRSFDFNLKGEIVSERYEASVDPIAEAEVVNEYEADAGLIGIEVNRGNRDLAVKIASELYTRIRAHYDIAHDLTVQKFQGTPNWKQFNDIGESYGRASVHRHALDVARVLAGIDGPPEGDSQHDGEIRNILGIGHVEYRATLFINDDYEDCREEIGNSLAVPQESVRNFGNSGWVGISAESLRKAREYVEAEKAKWIAAGSKRVITYRHHESPEAAQ